MPQKSVAKVVVHRKTINSSRVSAVTFYCCEFSHHVEFSLLNVAQNCLASCYIENA